MLLTSRNFLCSIENPHKKFLGYLDPDTDEFTFQTFTDSESRRKLYGKNPPTGRVNDPLARVFHGTLEKHWANLADLSREGAGIFVTVNRTQLCGPRKRENITAVRAYFVDCDGVSEDEIRAAIAAIGLTPLIVVKSSEGKYHIYWCVNDAPLSGFGKTQKKLAAVFGSDPAVSDLCRVLRVPGFPNQKDASCGTLVCLTYTRDGENYSDTVFQEALNKAIAARDSTPEPPLAPAWTAYDDAKLRSALAYVDARGKRIWDPNTGYEIWGKIVAPAIASLGWGEKGEEIFIDWSAQTTINGLFPGDEECREQVRSYKKGRGADCITEATIYKAVRDAGWKESQNAFLNQSNSSNTGAQAAGTSASRLGGLPIIDVIGGGLSNEATAGEDAIIKAGYPIYQRGTVLVRPVIQEVNATRGRTTKVAQLISVTQPYMVDLLCKVAKWERYDRRLKRNIRINPPDNIASVILHRCGEWNFNEVVGVITTPTLRSDGSLLIQPGYDPITRMILMEPPPMPPVAERPTRDNAVTALSLLDGLLDEFPFADTASRSVALSALITPVVRGAFTVAPMHAACAPVAGTGKSYVFDVAAAISIGQPCPVMAAGRNEEETEKRLGAAVLAGQPIISIDNINGELGGDALCQIVERPVVEIRILGKSERVRIETRCTLFVTGNNLVLLGDMTRRVVRATLDANKERPELRQFRRDPVGEVLADRGHFIAAALTVVRAYIAAGAPGVVSPLPSFEGWSNTVRSALIWLGRPDPVETMEAARKDDPTLQAMKAVFAALKEAMGIGQKSTVAEIIKLADQRVQVFPLAPDVLPPLKHPGLKEALQNIAGDRGGFIDSRTLGKWFSRHKGRIAQGVRLEGEADQHGHPARWYLIKCG